MAYLIFRFGFYLHIIFASVESEEINKVPDYTNNFVDGEKFFKGIVNGEKSKERPEYLIFTAPYRICSGRCNSSNVNNFNMIFPIYVGQKKSQTIYQKIYPRDHQTIFSNSDHAPFRKSTTKVPFTNCPTCSYDSEEARRPPFIGPDCKVKVEFNDIFKILFILMPITHVEVHGTLPWEHWSWSVPQEPIEYFFRRHESNNLISIKNPPIVCHCPPNKECSVEYEFNEDMLHFLHIKGLIKNEDFRQVKEDFMKANKILNTNDIHVRKRRNGEIIGASKEFKKDCCCPPMTLKVPTFITNKKFDEVLKRMTKIKKDNT